jgi:tellurite resistance protein TerC
MTVWLWIGFIVFVLAMLALDLGVFNRSAHVIKAREALMWTAVWVVTALLFNVLVYFMYEHHWLGIGLHVGHNVGGKKAALEFLTGYLIEKSLSLDNIFVIAVIFAYFNTPGQFQHRVLFWGVLGALIMRGVMIGAGAVLVARFDWIMYVFGVLLLITAGKMLFSKQEEIHPEKNVLIRLARRWFPVTTEYAGQHFFVKLEGRRTATPLFLVLLVVESTDVLFAVDSIPAIFAITQDPFIVFTSNVFAILGLRSLYFALAAMLDKFRYLKLALVFVLGFIAVKMLLHKVIHVSTGLSLGVVAAILAVGVIASLIYSRHSEPADAPAPAAPKTAAEGGGAQG